MLDKNFQILTDRHHILPFGRGDGIVLGRGRDAAENK